MTQVEYVVILLIDCGLTGKSARAWLNAEFGRKHADELSTAQLHGAIERLKVIKNGLQEEDRAEDRDDFKHYLAHDD